MIEGQRNLTNNSIGRFCEALKLNKQECLFFNSLVHFTLAIPNCGSSLYDQQNFDTEIGLPEGAFDDLRDVNFAASQGIIVPNDNAIDICLSELKGLPCTDQKVTDAYQPENLNPYAKTVDILPKSCEAFY